MLIFSIFLLTGIPLLLELGEYQFIMICKVYDPYGGVRGYFGSTPLHTSDDIVFKINNIKKMRISMKTRDLKTIGLLTMPKELRFS